MAKAWDMAQNLFWNAKPIIRSAEEQTWTENENVSDYYDSLLSLDWGSNVPGSGAPEKIMVASVQALENRGYKVSERGYELLHMGLAAHAEKDFVALHKISAELHKELRNAEKELIFANPTRAAYLTNKIVKWKGQVSNEIH